MDIGHTCGYVNVEGIQHSLVPSCVAADAYILIRVHLFRCSVSFEPSFDQHFHSLLTCDLLGNTRVKQDRPQVTTRQLP